MHILIPHLHIIYTFNQYIKHYLVFMSNRHNNILHNQYHNSFCNHQRFKRTVSRSISSSKSRTKSIQKRQTQNECIIKYIPNDHIDKIDKIDFIDNKNKDIIKRLNNFVENSNINESKISVEVLKLYENPQDIQEILVGVLKKLESKDKTIVYGIVKGYKEMKLKLQEKQSINTHLNKILDQYKQQIKKLSTKIHKNNYSKNEEIIEINNQLEVQNVKLNRQINQLKLKYINEEKNKFKLDETISSSQTSKKNQLEFFNASFDDSVNSNVPFLEIQLQEKEKQLSKAIMKIQQLETKIQRINDRNSQDKIKLISEYEKKVMQLQGKCQLLERQLNLLFKQEQINSIPQEMISSS